MDDIDALAEDLRTAVSRLARTDRQSDTLPPGEAAVLGQLDREGPQSISQLAEERAVRHQTAAKIVAQLENDGAVAKKIHPSDARMVQVRLTARGRSLLRKDRAARSRWFADAIRTQLTEAERKRLPTLVSALATLSRYDPSA